MLEKLLSGLTDYEQAVSCDCGQQARFHEMRPKQILTVLGSITIQRPYYLGSHCHQGQSHAGQNRRHLFLGEDVGQVAVDFRRPQQRARIGRQPAASVRERRERPGRCRAPGDRGPGLTGPMQAA